MRRGATPTPPLSGVLAVTRGYDAAQRAPTNDQVNGFSPHVMIRHTQSDGCTRYITLYMNQPGTQSSTEGELNDKGDEGEPGQGRYQCRDEKIN